MDEVVEISAKELESMRKKLAFCDVLLNAADDQALFEIIEDETAPYGFLWRKLMARNLDEINERWSI